MTARKPRIALSSCFFHADPKRPIFKGKTLVYAEHSIACWVMSGGGLTYLIPSIEPQLDQMARPQVSYSELAAGMDGLVLQGGSDVSPRSYGQEPLRPEWAGDYVRDQHELALLKAFLAQGKPVLGVCRGLQLLNVAYGGTLIQDIATQVPTALNHRDWEIYDQNHHRVTFERHSWLADWYDGRDGAPEAKVNTVHHQSIDRLGQGLIVEARSEKDGLIEAFRTADEGEWVYAVQWHPEFHDPRDPSWLDGAPMLAAFLARALQRSA